MKRPRATLWALAALLSAAFGLGRFLFAPAVWLAPVFLVRFARDAPGRWALPGFVAIHTVALEIAFLGTVPLPAAARIGMFLGLSLVLGLVFLADRAAARRSASLASTLVLPCGWAAFDFLIGRFSPNGSWGSIAYGLIPQWPMAQLASIGGWVALTFVLAWCGTLVNGAWDAVVAGRSPRLHAGVLGGLVVTLLLAGLVRPNLHDLGPSNRMTLLAAQDTFQGPHLEEVWEYTRGVETTPARAAAARRQIADWRERHMAMLADALAEGAELAAWSEVNAAFTREEESEWIGAAAALARENDAYVGLGIAVFGGLSRVATENRFVLLGPDGEPVWDFYKATRVPGDRHVVGDGRLPVADTPLGRLSGAICFDLDFPAVLRQAGRLDADVLIAPSNDWTEVRFLHARMAVMRAIEQGFYLVRPTKDGIHLAADPFGRVRARLDTDTGPETVLSVEVPSRGVVTIYSRIGDVFGWMTCFGFICLTILGVVSRVKTPVPRAVEKTS